MANAITLSRLPLLVGVVLLVYLGSPIVQVATAGVVLVLIVLDTVDGMVARRRREVGLVGSTLDIAVDRVVELVLWVVYAQLGLISVAIPIIFIVRGTLVDAVRSFGPMQGKTAFGMMETKWGRRLVASGLMRSAYGLSKLAAFCTLTLTLGLRRLWLATPRASWAEGLWVAAVVLSWLATAICILRGVPVLLEARTFLRKVDPTKTRSTDKR